MDKERLKKGHMFTDEYFERQMQNIREIRLSELPFYDEYYTQVIDVVKVFHPEPLDWLNVGCGTGKMAEAAFNQADLKRFVFNDCSKEMLELAKNRFDFPNTEFILSDVRELEFQAEFHVVTAIQVNHYFHEKDRCAIQ